MATMKINAGTQLQAGTLTDNEVASSAAIASTKLANWGADRDAGGFKLKNLDDPENSDEAATKNYVDTLVASSGGFWKTPVRLATNGVLGAAGINYNAETKTLSRSSGDNLSVDGVSPIAGDRILVKDSADPKQNGIYVVGDPSGPWNMTRAADCDESAEFIDAAVFVRQGTVNGNTAWVQTADSGFTMDTDDSTWGPITKPGGLLMREYFTGDGEDTTFDTTVAPAIAGSELVYLNGVLLRPGSGNDYTMSGTTVTMASAPDTGDVLQVVYFR